MARAAVRTLKLSDEGARFIARFEGFRARPYNDAAGHATIGYGHLLHHGKVTVRDRLRYAKGLTRAQALDLLKRDAAAAEKCVRTWTKVRLAQREFDALVSFVFNLGCGAFHGSTLLKRLNATAYETVPAELRKWDRAGGRVLEGLRRRRVAEGRVWTTGTYR